MERHFSKSNLNAFFKKYLNFSIVLFSLNTLQSQSWEYFTSSNSLLPENTTWCISIDQSGKVFVGTDYGLAIYDNEILTVFNSENSGLTSNSIRSIFHENDGSFWVGTFSGGLYHYQNGEWLNFNTQNSQIPDDFIKKIVKDQNGIYWIGTGNGLVKFDGQQVLEIFNNENSLLQSRNIAALEINANNIKVIGTINGGMAYYNDTTFTILWGNNSNLPDNTVTDFDFTEQGRPIFAMPDGGIAIHLGGNNFTWYNPIVVPAMPTKSIECIEYTGLGSFYAGSTDKGLIQRKSDGSWLSFNTSNSLISDNRIRDMVIDQQGKVWMATGSTGVVVFDSRPNNLESIESIAQVKLYVQYCNLFIMSQKEISNIMLYSIDGRLLYTGSLSGNKETQIPINQFSEKIILVNLWFADGNQYSKKLMIKP